MPVLLSCALALWLFVAVAGELKGDTSLAVDGIYSIAARVFSLLCYVMVAFILNSLRLFERRVGWLMSLFMWLAALSPFLNNNVLIAFSLLLLIASVAILFSCQFTAEHERALFMVFALMGAASLLVPVFVMLLPLFVAFTFFSNIITLKRALAMLLGLLTPFWLLFGVEYVYEPAKVLLSGMENFFVPENFFAALPPFHVLLSMAVELVVLIPASVMFFASSSSGKPLLRKRLLFVVMLNICLIIMSFVVPKEGVLLYACRVPGNAILMSYMFVQRITRFSNIYFIFVNLIWISLALYCLWMGLF